MAITFAPAILAISIVPNPIGPAPTTKTNSPDFTQALLTPCAPIASGSTKAIASNVKPCVCNNE